ncbi:glycosyltransferase WbuB [Notoacmeibacter marinus]|uniref:Glycosyltransferase WbuB n=1 Tax=Notoacmeibacter marinus TaxID=1876515 RepID=A0A231UTY1_9HYPH|nr:glycosyltransferase family 4 protein [Notoacmeibacter marinus]OXS99397.1 glycosyltransferase WbuB [Notoacmeibacter marinus]
MSRIWIINQYASIPKTGVGGRHRHLARELTGLGHEVTVIAASWTHLHPAELDPKTLPFSEQFEGFTFVHLPVPPYAHAHDKKRVLNWLRFSAALPGLPKRLNAKPDIVLVSSPSPFAYLGAERLARRVGAKLVFEVRDIWPLSLVQIGNYSPRHPMIRLMQWIEDRAYRNSDAVISNLPGAVEHMIERGMDPGKFAWIPNGFSKRDVEDPEPVDGEIEAMLPADKFIVGYAGTVGVANALDTLVDAATLMRDQPDILFAIIGEGREKPKLQGLVKDRGLSNVTFVPRVPKRQIATVLQRLAVCYFSLLPDEVFKFGIASNKFFDYLVAAKPILYAVDSGVYRPVDDFDCGITVPPVSPEAVVHAILELKNSSKTRLQDMGANGRAAAYNHHEYSQIARKLDATLSNL